MLTSERQETLDDSSRKAAFQTSFPSRRRVVEPWRDFGESCTCVGRLRPLAMSYTNVALPASHADVEIALRASALLSRSPTTIACAPVSSSASQSLKSEMVMPRRRRSYARAFLLENTRLMEL
jgi:hypothetical protein